MERERPDRDRGRERSPNYPQYPLPQAVADVKALYKREGRTAVPPEVAVRVWGYDTESGSMSGTARSRLASLKHYGLIETDKSGRIRLTERGLAVAVRTEGSPAYVLAVQEAALEPTIFRELRDEMGQASDDAIEYHLVTARHFSADGARKLCQSYRATMEFAGIGAPEDDLEYDSQRESDIREVPQMEAGLNHTRAPATPVPVGLPAGLPAVPAGADQYQFRIGGTTATVILAGGRVTRRTLERLRRHLELTEEDLPDDPAPAPAE